MNKSISSLSKFKSSILVLLLMLISILITFIAFSPKTYAFSPDESIDGVKAKDKYIDAIDYINSPEAKKIIKGNININNPEPQTIKLDHNIECLLTLRTTKEVSYVDFDEFCKSALATGSFYLVENNNKKELLFENYMSVTFTYDKISKVYLEDAKRQIIFGRTLFDEDDWKIVGSNEILDASGQSIVSGLWSIYEKEGLDLRWDYVDNFYTDIICNPDGDIRFSVKNNL